MADFGGFEIEDDEKKPSPPSAFGGFEIEDGDEGASGEKTPVASAEASTPKSPAPTVASPAPEALPVPTWESGDGGAATLPEGETNQWGGNLRNEGRKPLIRRDANGKVNGYSTTTSMLVRHDDGKFAVVPTVVDGEELSPEDAVRHYAETGEYWGMADDEEGAKKIARAVHEKHAELNRKQWNEYLQNHWDELSDEIRNDPGMRGEHSKRRREARVKEAGVDKAAQMASKKKEQMLIGQSVAGPVYGEKEIQPATVQVAPDLFLTGDVLDDSEGRTVKPGQFVTLSRKDGTSQLLSFEGASEDGKPVFKEVKGVATAGADLAGEINISEDDYNRMFDAGNAKVDRPFWEQVRNDALANTGDAYRYTDDARGTFNAFYDYLMPFLGGSAKKEHEERTRILSDIREGRLDGYDGKDEAEKLRDAARKAKLEPWNPLESLHPGESDEDFAQRIRQEAEGELKLGAAAKGRAEQARQQTEATVGDKILKGGVESGAFALQFAIPGSIMFKGLSSMGLGAKAVRALTTLGSAIPATVAEADKRYSENITPEYGWKQTSLDGEPEFGMVAAPDAPGEAAYKAIGGAVFDSAVEVGLEAATMGLLRLAGKPAGWLLGKATPGAVKEWGAKKFNRFMASETGLALRQINRAYQDFAGMTQINSPLGELAEENVQALEKVLNLDGKTSEYKGLQKEWNDFYDRQFNADTQWDIFYGLIAQLGLGAAKSTAEGVARHVSEADVRRDVRMALARSGISEATLKTLTPEQQKKLGDMWRQYSADPDALKENVKDLGISMRLAVDELTAREGLKMRQSLEQRGIAPERFTIQTGADGKPAFQKMTRFTPDGKKAPMNAMTDAAHGVTIVDQGDGNFYVMNDFRGLDAIPASSFEEAQRKADEEVVRNQSMDADNEQKTQYLMGLVQRQYAGRNVVSIPSEAALRWQVAQAIRDGRPLYGITRADQLFREDGSLRQLGAGGFHTPDGHIVVILDNVPSPAEMERVLAHEATGHEGVESATGRGAKTVEFIQNAQAEGFSRFVEGERQRRIAANMKAGMDEESAVAEAEAHMATDEYKRESMARYAQGRLHAPTWYERRKHEANERRRAAGENVPTDQADLEVMLAEQEAQGRAGDNELETLNADSGVRYEEGAEDETGNGAAEAPAQPEQGEERGQEAPRPEAGAEPGAQAPDAGVVRPKTKRGQNLRGYSYEDYAAHPDDGGTGDQMGAELLRFARDNGGLLKIPPKGTADPLADWIAGFMDGNARKNRRGDFIALFGMKPRTGTNDALVENMPPDLQTYVGNMIEREGPGAVADWFLETRRKYREWAQGRRDAAREERMVAKDRAEEGEALESFDFDELAAARDAMDEEFANALGVVEGADEADYATLSPASLRSAKAGDTIRFDHDARAFNFGSFDAERGVLTVYDEEAAGREGEKFRRVYRVTENSIEEINDGQGNEVRADADRAGDEKGPAGGGGEAQGGGFQLESVTAEQITAEEKKRREKAEIKKRQEAPLRGSGAVNVQPEMDLGQTGQQDLFSPTAKNEETPPAAKEKAVERPAEYLAWLEKYKMKDTDRRFAEWQRKQSAQKPVKATLAAAQKRTAATTPPKATKLPKGETPKADETMAAKNINVSAFVKAQREAEADDAYEGDRGLADLIESLPLEKAQKLVGLWNESNRLDDEADKLVDEHSRLNRFNQTKFDSDENERKHADLRARARDLQNEAHNMLLREAEANGWEQGEDAETGGVRWVKRPAQKPAKTAPVSAPRAKGTTTPPKSADALQGGKSAENAALAVWPKGWEHGKSLYGYIRATKADITALKPGDEVAVAHTSGGVFGAKQAIFAIVRSVGEEYDGAANADIFIGDYKDGVGYDQDARFKKSEIVGIKRSAPVRESRTTENQDDANNFDEVRAAFEREHGVKFGSDSFTPWTYPEKGVAERYRVLDGPWGASVGTERVDLKSVRADIKSAIGSNSAYRDKVAERTKAFLESGGDVDALVKWKDAPDVVEDIVVRAAEKMGVGLTRGDARLPKQIDEILSELKSIIPRRTTEKSSQVATPPEAAKPAEGGKSASGSAPKSSAPTTARTTATPAFKRGDRVFVKGAKDGQRVTFLKANADGTADVQVRTPGANRYAPEKVETRTVPMGDVSSTGMKDTLTDAERTAYRHGMAEQTRESMRDDPALRRIDAAYRAAKTDAERNALKAQFAERVRALQGGVNFDTRELAGPSGRQKQAGVAYPDASEEIRAQVSFDTPELGKKSREDFGRILAKHRPDLDANAVIDEIAKFDTPKKRKAALHWVVRGAIRLPEDAYKVEDALSVAEKAKVDPFAYSSPLALIEAHKDIKPMRRAIDPATVPELSDPRDEGDGIVSYEVSDTREGQAAMRRIIDTHWGEDANPWCLLARHHKDEQITSDFWNYMLSEHGGNQVETRADFAASPKSWRAQYERVTGKSATFTPDPMEDAWDYWNHYNALPKRVAFKDGKLLAFMATEGDYAVKSWRKAIQESRDNADKLEKLGDRIRSGEPLPDRDEILDELDVFLETTDVTGVLSDDANELRDRISDWYGGDAENPIVTEEDRGLFDEALDAAILRLRDSADEAEYDNLQNIPEEWWDRQDESHPDLDWARGNAQVNFDTPELSADYSSVPERLDHSLWWISTHDEQIRSDIAALRKTAERNIKAGADDTPSESEARSLRERINKANAYARARKKLAEETSFEDIKKRYLNDEKYYREEAKELREELKRLEKEGIGDDREEVDWYTNGDLLEILDSIESGEASTSMHFDPYAIGRGEAGPFAEALKNLAESGIFKGKDLERFDRVAQKINDAYKAIERDIEDPRGSFGESLVSFDTPELSSVSPAEDAAYMDAVRRGDMETAQRMVREAAARAGYGHVAYHGTPFGGWNQYDFSRGGMESGNGRGVISLTSDRSEAEAYSKSDSAADVSDIMFRVNNVLARIPDEAWSATTDIGMDGERFAFDSAAFSDYADGFTNMPDEANFDSPAEYRKAAQDAEREGYLSAMSSVLSDMKSAMPEQGAIIDEAAKLLDDASSQNPEVKSLYVRVTNAFEAAATPQTYGRVAAKAEQVIREGKNDGAIIRLEDGTLRYFVKGPSQIKSADPVTYDDAGNVIPLSQRFNPQNDDIRFDTPELTPAEAEKAYREWLGKYRLKDTPDRRREWEGKRPSARRQETGGRTEGESLFDGYLDELLGIAGATPQNPLGQVVPPPDGSVAQSIDAEIAADEARAARGAARAQGEPPAPAPGSQGNERLDPGYEPESLGAGVKDPVSRQEIVDKFRELFSDTVAIRGKNTTRIGKYAGHYEPGAGIIRSKDPVSLRTIPHELGHHIDAILKKHGPMRPNAVKAELIALGKKLYGGKQPAGGYQSEGFAEMVKYYLQGNEKGLKKEAPAVYNWLVNDFGKAHPDIMEKMDALRDMIDRFQNQSGDEAVRAIRAKDPNLAERIVGRLADMIKGLKLTQENWIDTGAFITKGMRASGLDKLMDWRAALKRGDVAEMNDIIENHPVLKWKLYNGKSAARAYQALAGGLTDLSGTRRYTYGDLGMATPGHAADEKLPTFKEIFGGFTPEEMDEFENYAIARIAKEAYLDKGLEFGLTKSEIAPTLAKHARNTKFRDALERYTHYKHGVLHLLVDAGAMSQEQFEEIVKANPIYVKIARRRESADLFRDRMLKKRGKAVNRRTGSGRQVEDIFDAGLVDDERVFSAAFQADLLRSLVNLGKRGEANNAAPGGALQGELSVGANWIHEVPNAQGAVRFTAEQLRKQITDAMRGAAMAPDKAAADSLFDQLFGDGKDILTVFKQKPSEGKNGLVSLYDEDGTLHTYELPENNAEGWAKGLMGFTDSKKPNILEQWAQIAAAATRTGATILNPTFALRNIVRDTLHASTVNEFGFMIPGLSTVQGIAMDMMGSNAKEIFDAMGIPMGSMLGESRLQSARRANRYLMSRNWFEAQWNKGVKKAIADFVGFSENGTRIKEFKLVRDYMLSHGASEKAADMLAGANALDITIDFQRGGEVAKSINRFIPFFNAGIQGLEQTARAFGLLHAKEWQLETDRKRRAGRTVLQGAAWLLMLSLLAELFNRSDDDRKRKIDELKPHERWNYISFGDVRLPVPYEIGYIFSSIPRAIIAELYDGQKGAVAECLGMFRQTLPGISPTDIAFIGPALNTAMNEYWHGGTIVPEYIQKGKLSYDWYDERTSEFSKMLGKAMYKVFGQGKFSSPAHIDAFMNGITGNMYGRTLGAIGGQAELDASRPNTWPVVGTFFRNNLTANRLVGEFYERKIELERKKGSGVATDGELAELHNAGKLVKRFVELRKESQKAKEDKSLSATERNDRLEKIVLEMQQGVRDYNKNPSGGDETAYDIEAKAFGDANGKYEKAKKDKSVPKAEQEKRLSDIRDANPLMRDDVRGKLLALKKDIAKLERNEKTLRENGASKKRVDEVSASIVQRKAEFLDAVRKARGGASAEK